jgi:hypothetical protein
MQLPLWQGLMLLITGTGILACFTGAGLRFSLALPTSVFPLSAPVRDSV